MDLVVTDASAEPVVFKDAGMESSAVGRQCEGCPTDAKEPQCLRDAARNTSASPFAAIPSTSPDVLDAGEQHLQACLPSDPDAGDEPGRSSRPTTRRGSRDHLV